MNKFESSYKKLMGYKIACTNCNDLYTRPDDEPFVCSPCSN